MAYALFLEPEPEPLELERTALLILLSETRERARKAGDALMVNELGILEKNIQLANCRRAFSDLAVALRCARQMIKPCA